MSSGAIVLTGLIDDVNNKIFEFLDLQSVGRFGNVNKHSDKLRNIFLQNYPSLYTIPIDSEEPLGNCTLNLRDRTIIIPVFRAILEQGRDALKHPAVPKGSFMVFICHEQYEEPSAVIKDKNGKIKMLFDVASFLNSPILTEIRNLQGKPSQYHHYKTVELDPSWSNDDSYIMQLNRALALVTIGTESAKSN